MSTRRFVTPRSVLRYPGQIGPELLGHGLVHGLTDVECRVATPSMVVLWLTLEPWAPLAAEGFPTERVAITVWAGGRIVAVPVDPEGRSWLHRNTFELGSMGQLGELCLWYPGDPLALQWRWRDGLVAFITIVHRHLQAEEFWRRHGYWPAEDAPHGAGPHPIRTAAMRRAAVNTGAAA